MEKYKFDFTTKTLTITKAFADKAEKDPESAEKNTILRFQKDFPDMSIRLRTHKTPSKYHAKSGEVYNCNQYKNLSYNKMERFINALPEGENRDKVKEAYNYLRYGTGLVQTSTYKAVREWFVAQFPEYRKDPLFYLYNEVVIIDLKPILDQQAKKEAKQN